MNHIPEYFQSQSNF